MRLTEQVVARLRVDAAVSALVGMRIYPAVLPQPPTFPAIAYTRISQREAFSADGAEGLLATRTQLDCYALTYDGARLLGDAVRAALNGYVGGVIQKSQQDSEEDVYEPQVGSVDEGQSHRVTMDFLVEGSED